MAAVFEVFTCKREPCYATVTDKYTHGCGSKEGQNGHHRLVGTCQERSRSRACMLTLLSARRGGNFVVWS